MQLLPTKKRQSLDPLRTNRKNKMSPINLLKHKKNSENYKSRNQSPTKKIEVKLTAITNTLELEKLMLCGGMKLNTRFNQSVQKRKKNIATLKTVRLTNPEKIELGSNTTPNYFVNFASSPVSLAKRSKMLQNIQLSKFTPSLPSIDAKDIIIAKQSYSNKTDNLYGFSQKLKCYVSLYKSQNDNNTVIEHPNILSAYGLCTLQNTNEKYYVTDMFEGSSLKNLIVEFGSLHEITAKIYIRQLVEGTSKIHSLGLAHNRLNMDNLLHDKQGKLLISWFRSCKSPPNESEKSLYLYFFPPETLLSQDSNDKQKKDIWAIGCIALQMLVAKPLKLNKHHPYNDNLTNKDLTQSIIILQKVQNIAQQKNIIPANNPNIESNSQISPLALDFIQKCLSIRIQNRPTINQLMTHPFISDYPQE